MVWVEWFLKVLEGVQLWEIEPNDLKKRGIEKKVNPLKSIVTWRHRVTFSRSLLLVRKKNVALSWCE